MRLSAQDSGAARQKVVQEKGYQMNKHLIGLSMGVAAIAFTASAYAAGGNKTYTDQSANTNRITVNQNDNGSGIETLTAGTGGGNSVGSLFRPFTQGGSGDNVLTVNQTGTGNSLGNQKQGQQIGSGNTADVTQQGVKGRVELQQNGVEVDGRPVLVRCRLKSRQANDEGCQLKPNSAATKLSWKKRTREKGT